MQRKYIRPSRARVRYERGDQPQAHLWPIGLTDGVDHQASEPREGRNRRHDLQQGAVIHVQLLQLQARAQAGLVDKPAVHTFMLLVAVAGWLAAVHVQEGWPRKWEHRCKPSRQDFADTARTVSVKKKKPPGTAAAAAPAMLVWRTRWRVPAGSAAAGSRAGGTPVPEFLDSEHTALVARCSAAHRATTPPPCPSWSER